MELVAELLLLFLFLEVFEFRGIRGRRRRRGRESEKRKREVSRASGGQKTFDSPAPPQMEPRGALLCSLPMLRASIDIERRAIYRNRRRRGRAEGACDAGAWLDGAVLSFLAFFALSRVSSSMPSKSLELRPVPVVLFPLLLAEATRRLRSACRAMVVQREVRNRRSTTRTRGTCFFGWPPSIRHNVVAEREEAKKQNSPTPLLLPRSLFRRRADATRTSSMMMMMLCSSPPTPKKNKREDPPRSTSCASSRRRRRSGPRPSGAWPSERQ